MYDEIRLVKSTEQIWLEAQSILRKKLSHGSFAGWIKSLQLVDLENNQLAIAVKNEFVRGMITNHYLKAITEARFPSIATMMYQ